METENQKPEPGKQMLMLTINTIVDSDEDAIHIKKKVTEVLKNVKGVQINFGLSNAPRPR